MTSYLDELDDILLRQFDDGMLLSELDGYLTGLILSPDLVSPERWLKPIWGDAPPPFEDAAALQRFLDLVMTHQNALVESLGAPGDYAPIFDSDPRTGEILWELWADGFGQAMKLAPAGWNRIRASDQAAPKAALAGLVDLTVAATNSAPTGMDVQQRRDQQASDLVPIWVQLLHEWRQDNDRNPSASTGKAHVGRNDPCPCGSGKKYKKCCGVQG